MSRGIHHVTAISGDIEPTLDFYRRVLGLRLVKQTVNYDDPGTYHLYFGDEIGRPGTALTFFPVPGGIRGRAGAGQVGVTSFLVPETSLEYWAARLAANGVAVEGPSARFQERVLTLRDPDGMALEIVAGPEGARVDPWADGPVSPEHAIRGFHGVTIPVSGDPGTRDLLVDRLGFTVLAEEGDRLRLAGDAPVGAYVDLRQVPGLRWGSGGVGTVHHVAFRAPDDAAQAAVQRELRDADVAVTPVRDRQYFRSVYFHEPGGVLFEVATDGPGFTADESAAELGSRLRLPAWLEGSRDEIERALPPLALPALRREEASHAVR
jgi:glyoxalase family protein